MSDSDLALSVRNISKRYMIARTGGSSPEQATRDHGKRLRPGSRDEFWALRDISFDVARGDVLGIVGKNGAGKSTLLKILSRITEPTAGQIDVFGEIASLLEVGTGFHPELTGRENVFLNGAILGMRRHEIAAQFDEIVEFSGVERFLDTPVKRYSSGMYVRLAFAVAAHLNPDILIIDEVLAVGDAEFQKKCLGKVQAVAAHGRTVLFVSHNLTVVQSVCTRAMLLVDGQIAAFGRTPEVLAKYRDAGAAASGPLSLHNSGRLGNGDAVFASLEVLTRDNTGAPTRQLERGGTLVIRVEIEARKQLINGNVAAVIYDQTGVRVIDANTEVRNMFVSLGAGESTVVDLELRSVLLKEGTYSIGLWLGRTINDCCDHVEYAGTFEAAHDAERLRLEMFPGPYTCDFDARIGCNASTSLTTH